MKPMYFYRATREVPEGLAVLDWQATYEDAHKQAIEQEWPNCRIQGIRVPITKDNLLALLNNDELEGVEYL